VEGSTALSTRMGRESPPAFAAVAHPARSGCFLVPQVAQSQALFPLEKSCSIGPVTLMKNQGLKGLQGL